MRSRVKNAKYDRPYKDLAIVLIVPRVFHLASKSANYLCCAYRQNTLDLTITLLVGL